MTGRRAARRTALELLYQWDLTGQALRSLHDGDVEGEYATKEAAFESAVAAASLAIREGHEVHVSVPSRVASGRTRSAVASLTPTMRGSSARRAMVSIDMSTTLRPGML